MGKQNAGLKTCICEFKNDLECAAWNRLGFLNLNFFSKLAEPFLFQISLVILLTACHKNSYDISSENTELDQIIFPPVEIFLYSHHLSAWYCSDIVCLGQGFELPGTLP